MSRFKLEKLLNTSKIVFQMWRIKLLQQEQKHFPIKSETSMMRWKQVDKMFKTWWIPLEINVNLPKSNVSTKIDDFAGRIQQISVDHKQKIAAFEGRGGGRSIPTPVNNMQEFFETDFGEQLKSSVRKIKKRYDGQTIYEVVDKSIPGLKKGDQIYLDGMHKDHLEVFSRNGKISQVINLDGSINLRKTEEGIRQGRRIKWQLRKNWIRSLKIFHWFKQVNPRWSFQ